MSWLDVFWACLTALALWTALGLFAAALLGPLLARRAMQQATRSMLGPVLASSATTRGPVFSATASNMPTVTDDDLEAAGLTAEDK